MKEYTIRNHENVFVFAWLLAVKFVMVEEQQRTCTLNEFCRRFVVAFVCVCIITGTFLLENERTLSFPHPRANFELNAYMLSNGSMREIKQGQKITLTTTTSAPPFNYLRTRQWGKQDKAAWKLYYGDLDCHENHRRRTMIAILRTWLKLTRKYNIEYAFYFGSLLGIVRNNDVNPWDHDMDILVPYSDIVKLEKVGWPRTNRRAWDGLTFINYIPNSQHNVSIDDRKRWNCDGKVSQYILNLAQGCLGNSPIISYTCFNFQ